MNNLIIDKLKEIMQLHINIKLDNLEYTSKKGKCYNFNRHFLPIVFLRDIHKGNLSLENSDEQKLQLANELKDMGNSEVPIQKRSVLKNA